uniref:Uncharacterized protein n=1 Tax=Skeletonema marinoi TaxID=267567 RepID=A0A7S2KZ79_9STRA
MASPAALLECPPAVGLFPACRQFHPKGPPLQNTPTSTTLTPNNFTLLNKLHLRTHTTILNSLRSHILITAHARIIVTDVINSHTSSSLDITGGTYLDRSPCR